MSDSYIPVALRREVEVRADYCCEYCLIGQEDKPVSFAVDHIIAEKYGGTTTRENLCLSCYWCNSYKGSDLSSVDWEHGGEIVPLFHPRTQVWQDHFRIEGVLITPLTAPARVTAFLLRLNAIERTQERAILLTLGRYPGK